MIYMSFDEKKLKRSFADDEEVLLEVLPTLVEQIPVHISNIDKARDSNDFENLDITAHTLKGLCATVCAEKSRELAAKIEQLGKSKSDLNLETLCSDLKIETSKLIDDLNKLLNSKKAA